MCLLFLYVNDHADESEYRVILASNRDEQWDRPTKPLGFWENNPSCISGVDLGEGMNGGTWLGMSRNGRIGVLVNIKGKAEVKKTRGNLVNEYLTSDLSCQDYINKEVAPIKDSYNGFQLVLLDLSTSPCGISYFNNKCSDVTSALENGICVVGNGTSFNSPFRKCVYGKDKFESIVKEFHSKDKKDELKNALIDLLKDDTRFPDDPQIEKQSGDQFTTKQLRDELSAPFVWSPWLRYGTRTHSLILVDGKGHCEFSEWTMATPVNPEENIEWEFNKFEFEIQVMENPS